jgi:hypothetical protein
MQSCQVGSRRCQFNPEDAMKCLPWMTWRLIDRATLSALILPKHDLFKPVHFFVVCRRPVERVPHAPSSGLLCLRPGSQLQRDGDMALKEGDLVWAKVRESAMSPIAPSYRACLHGPVTDHAGARLSLVARTGGSGQRCHADSDAPSHAACACLGPRLGSFCKGVIFLVKRPVSLLNR